MGKEDPKFRLTEMRKEFNRNAAACEQNGTHNAAWIWRAAKRLAEKYMRAAIAAAEK
jgi:hypothetical protein